MQEGKLGTGWGMCGQVDGMVGAPAHDTHKSQTNQCQESRIHECNHSTLQSAPVTLRVCQAEPQTVSSTISLDINVLLTPLNTAVVDGKEQMFFRMDVKEVLARIPPDQPGLPEKQKDMNAYMKKSLSDYSGLQKVFMRPFYYRQTCDLVITDVIHARDESANVVAMKKGIATSFSHATENQGPSPVKPNARYEASLLDTNGLQTYRYQKTQEGDTHVFHSSSLMQVKASQDGTSATAEANEEDQSILHCQVGKLTVKDGKVEGFASKSAGGMLSNSSSNNPGDLLLQMQQADSKTKGRGASSVQAQSAHSSRSYLASKGDSVRKKGTTAEENLFTQLQAVQKSSEFIELVSRHHGRHMVEASLHVTKADHEEIARSKSKFDSKAAQAHIDALDAKALQQHEKLNHLKALSKIARYHGAETVKLFSYCLLKDATCAKHYKTRVTLCNILSCAGLESGQALLSTLLGNPGNDRQAALTAMNMLTVATPAILHQVNELTKSKDENTVNSALLCLGTMISHNQHDETQQELLQSVLRRKLHPELLMGFIQNAKPQGGVERIEGALSHSDDGTRVAALQALSSYTSHKTTELALQQYEDDDARHVIHAHALEALRQKGTSEESSKRIYRATVRRLKRAAGNKHRHVNDDKYPKAVLSATQQYFSHRHKEVTGAEPTPASLATETSFHTAALLALREPPCDGAKGLFKTLPCGMDNVLLREKERAYILVLLQPHWRVVCREARLW